MASTVILRHTYCMTQKDISDYFGIPLNTVKNWDSRKCMPEYLERMMLCVLEIRRACKLLADIENDCTSKDCKRRVDNIVNFISHTVMTNLGYELYAVDDHIYKYEDKGHIDG